MKVLSRFELRAGSEVLRNQDELVMDTIIAFIKDLVEAIAIQVPLITMAFEEVTLVNFDDTFAKMSTTSRRAHVVKVELSGEVKHLSKALRTILYRTLFGSFQGLTPEIASYNQLQHGEQDVRCSKECVLLII